MRLPLTFQDKVAEERYQAEHGMPAVPFYIAVVLGLCIKVLVIANTARRPPSAERSFSQLLGAIALSIAVLQIVLASYGGQLFKQTWRALSALHCIASAAHAMVSHAFLSKAEVLEVPNPSFSAYLNVYLVSSCAVPLFTMSVGSWLPIWLQVAVHLVIATVSLAFNPALCSKLAILGDIWLHQTAAHILQTMSGIGNAFFADGSLPAAVPTALTCEHVLFAMQILAAFAAICVNVVGEVLSRQSFATKYMEREPMSPADAVAWRPNRSHLAVVVAKLTPLALVAFFALWLGTLLLFPYVDDASVWVLRNAKVML